MNSAVTTGVERWINLHKHPDPLHCINALRSAGYIILASDLDPSSVSIDNIKDLHHSQSPLSSSSPPKLAFVFGNELSGISDIIKQNSDMRFILPMFGFAQSFNISVSVGITLTYLRSFGLLVPDLTEEESDRIKLSWLMTEFKHPKSILRQHDMDYDMIIKSSQ